MEMRDPVVSPFKMWPVEAPGDSCGARGMCAVWEAVILFPSAARTVIFVDERVGLEQWDWSWTVM